VHVWSASLQVGADQQHRLAMLLNEEERQRADRYLHLPSRDRYLVARGLLRVLLGRYLDVSPHAVRFHSGPQGKPTLAYSSVLHFNLSHSEDVILLAFSRQTEVGIDVEHVRAGPTFFEIADRFFTPRESSALRSLSPERSAEAFYQVWTRKEAYLKATGLGLTYGLERFEVSVPPDDPARILHIDGDQRAADCWSLLELTPAPGYVGALALQGHGHQVKCWSWREE
jgi:4'-phosphopantetheinyl transferase